MARKMESTMKMDMNRKAMYSHTEKAKGENLRARGTHGVGTGGEHERAEDTRGVQR